MNNAIDTSAKLQPPAATAEPPTALAKDSAQHPERQYPQNPSHAVDGTQTGAANAVPPCPDWCTLPAGHAFEVDFGSVFRLHETDLFEVAVTDEAPSVAYGQLYAFQRQGQPTDTPKIRLVARDCIMTSDQAHELGVQICLAARRLDKINGGAQ